jgi:hypothetical protein
VCHGRFHGVLPKEHPGAFYDVPWGLCKEISTNNHGQSDISEIKNIITAANGLFSKIGRENIRLRSYICQRQSLCSNGDKEQNRFMTPTPVKQSQIDLFVELVQPTLHHDVALTVGSLPNVLRSMLYTNFYFFIFGDSAKSSHSFITTLSLRVLLG